MLVTKTIYESDKIIYESNPRPRVRRGFDSQLEGLGVAFFATGPGLGLITYIFTTLEFLNITLIYTTSMNAKYYYELYSSTLTPGSIDRFNILHEV